MAQLTQTILIEMVTVDKRTDVTKKNEKETGRHRYSLLETILTLIFSPKKLYLIPHKVKCSQVFKKKFKTYIYMYRILM